MTLEQERLRRLEDDWHALNLRADEVVKDLREQTGIGHDLESRIQELHDRREHLRTHLAELRAAGDGGSAAIPSEIDAATRELARAVDALDRRRAAAARPTG